MVHCRSGRMRFAAQTDFHPFKFDLHADHIQRAKQQSWDEVPPAQHNRRLLVWNIPGPYDDLEGVGTYGALLSNPLSGNISYHPDNQFHFL